MINLGCLYVIEELLGHVESRSEVFGGKVLCHSPLEGALTCARERFWLNDSVGRAFLEYSFWYEKLGFTDNLLLLQLSFHCFLLVHFLHQCFFSSILNFLCLTEKLWDLNDFDQLYKFDITASFSSNSWCSANSCNIGSIIRLKNKIIWLTWKVLHNKVYIHRHRQYWNNIKPKEEAPCISW